MVSNLFKSCEWKSSFRPIRVKFNKNVWWLISSSYDDVDGSLFGVMDQNDGSSFSIDFSYIADDEGYSYEWCESEYFSRLYNISNNTKEIDRFPLNIDDIEFQCVSYSFENRKFGDQIIVRGMAIGESAVMGVSIAWPEMLTLDSKQRVPPKHAYFLDNLELGVDLNS